MFRIRRIHDDVIPANQEAIRQVQVILHHHFSAVRREEIDGLADKLRNPFKQGFRTVLLVAERQRKGVVGFGLLTHEPEIRFSYLDFIASAKDMTGRGIGGSLYQRVRQESAALGARGLFFECLPDDPAECDSKELLKENIARLRFYERFGARPIIGTAYESPIQPDDHCMPYLVYDSLKSQEPLGRNFARKVVQTILERKYGHCCPPDYTRRVVKSFADNPVRIRAPRYLRKPAEIEWPRTSTSEPIALVINDRHDIHHIRERGYVQSPVRIKSILSELQQTKWFEVIPPRNYAHGVVKTVHASDFVTYIRKACASVPHGKSVYPYVFPIRNSARPPKELSVRAGYYCIDTFTPLNANAYLAAKRAVDCTLTAADALLHGRRISYALVRPPGHHAERRVFGGFCYFNNNAIAAEYLSHSGKVAILDLDYHHGNGQQDIFYERSDVLTISIHGHPNFAYPYFSGFATERGMDAGEGFNLNLPLPEVVGGTQYRVALTKALKRVAKFDPSLVVVALGLDTAKGDPTGTWSLTSRDFEMNGRMLHELDKPMLIVQEGGYRTRTLGINARSFFAGLLGGVRQ